MAIRVLIAADMEGVSGVVNWDQVTPGHYEYDRFRHIMTADLNAAVKGALQGGVDEVVVTDGHDRQNTILLEELDPRVKLNSGNPAPLAMVQGIESGINAVMLVGYHARAGTTNAVLDHTWSSIVLNLWLNGQLCGEIGLNAAVCGHFNIPVLMVSGDQAAGAEAADLLPNAEIAVVKTGRGRYAAECLPLETAHQRIRDAAARAISHLRIDPALPPHRIEPPILVTVEFHTSNMADMVSLLPGVDRLDGRRIQYTADDMRSAYRFFRSAVILAGS
ncbi:MAG TPA: M55 family metallopeptidase [Anaerolineaceae bacterium]